MSNNVNRDSPLVAAAIALQNHLTELDRVGNKIAAADMTTDAHLEYVQKLMTRFTACGEGISQEVKNLSLNLQEVTFRVQTVADAVSRQAEAFTRRKNELDARLEQFRLLGDKVRAMNASIAELTRVHADARTLEERATLALSIPGIEEHLASLIEELQAIRNSARSSRMKDLEKNAASLAQSLQALQARIHAFAGGLATAE